MPGITIRPLAALVLAIMTTTAGWIMYTIADQQGLTGLSAPTYIGLFVGTLLGIGLVHEMGHVAAGVALGARWTRLTIGLGFAVSLTRRSNGEQIVISLAGPAAHLVGVAVVLMWTQRSPLELDPVNIAAWFMLIEAGVNMLPIRPLDGHRLFTAGWACLRGRSAETFAGISESEPQHPHQTITEEEPCHNPSI